MTCLERGSVHSEEARVITSLEGKDKRQSRTVEDKRSKDCTLKNANLAF